MTDSHSTSREVRVLPRGPVAGDVTPPPSKSATHRALNLALLAGGPVEIERPLEAEDTGLFVAALERLGWSSARRGDVLALAPGPRPPRAEIHCGNAGTMARFLAATLTALPGEWRLDGVERLRERPIGALVDALRGLGARLDYLGREGFPPLRIQGGTLAGGAVTLAAGESSQYLSALLMAGLRARAPLEVEVRELVSAPYVELTLAAMAGFGARAERTSGGVRVAPQEFGVGRARIEGDWSAAAYPAAAAALGGGVRLHGLDPASPQGDRAFLGVLAAMGAGVRWQGEALAVSAAPALAAVDADLGAMPDQVPTLAALAPFARGVTRIRNVPHLRIKESDRLAAMADGLRSLGAEVEELADGLVVPGVWAEREPPRDAVTVDPCGDHRIAMSLALLALRRPGARVATPAVVAKSYPGFWTDWERLTRR